MLGEMEVARRRGRRRRKLLDDLKDRRGYSHLKEEALDRTMWRNRFGGGFGPVVRQNTEWMDVGNSGFGGLVVACCPLVPKFMGSNPAEAFGYLRSKKSSARLPSEGK